LPAQWGGIFVVRGENGGGVANISYADINNTVLGLNVGSSSCDWLDNELPDGLTEDEEIAWLVNFFGSCFDSNNIPEVNVENTVIRNSLLSGVASVWSNISMTNSLIYNCGDHNLQLELGGNHEFKHCTFANYGSQDLIHIEPIVSVGVIQPNLPIAPVTFSGTFENCLVLGSQSEEIEILEDFIDDVPFGLLFDHCIVKTERSLDSDLFNNSLKNPSFADTMFVSLFEDDYHLNNKSMARDNGLELGISIDLDGLSRDAQPDIGCYEYFE